MACALAVAACGSPSGSSDGEPVDSSVVEDPEVPRAQERLDSLATAIEAAVGAARAERPEQCRTIAYGAKPCGGPWRYLVYSTAATDSTRLTWMVNEYNDTEAYLNEKLGRASDCSLVLDPGARLEDGHCVAGGG